MSRSMASTTPWTDGLSATDSAADVKAMPRLLRVSCPQGHTLDAPCILDGQEVVCPYCGVRFLFSYAQSEEYRREHGKPAPDNRRTSRFWLDWAALTVTVTVAGVLLLEWLDHAH